MMPYVTILIFLVVAIGLVFLYLRYREKTRQELFLVILNLAREEMAAELERMSLDAVQQRYEALKETLENLYRTARKDHEFALCKKFEKELGKWRVRKIQEIYNQRLNILLDKIKKEHNHRKRLNLLYQARDLIKEGVLDTERLNKVENWIVHAHIKDVRNREQGLSPEMKYKLYEEVITEILNSGISDELLENAADFKELITDFEILEKRLKRTRKST